MELCWNFGNLVSKDCSENDFQGPETMARCSIPLI